MLYQDAAPLSPKFKAQARMFKIIPTASAKAQAQIKRIRFCIIKNTLLIQEKVQTAIYDRLIRFT